MKAGPGDKENDCKHNRHHRGEMRGKGALSGRYARRMLQAQGARLITILSLYVGFNSIF